MNKISGDEGPAKKKTRPHFENTCRENMSRTFLDAQPIGMAGKNIPTSASASHTSGTWDVFPPGMRRVSSSSRRACADSNYVLIRDH